MLFEPEVGAGRPDAIVITVSKAALERCQATGLRVLTSSAMRALTDTDEMALGYRPSTSELFASNSKRRTGTLSSLAERRMLSTIGWLSRYPIVNCRWEYPGLRPHNSTSPMWLRNQATYKGHGRGEVEE